MIQFQDFFDVLWHIYIIDYFFNIAPSFDTNYTVSVKVPEAKILVSDIRSEGKANSISRVNGSVIFELTENDEVTRVITKNQTIDLIFEEITNVKLNVMKLD